MAKGISVDYVAEDLDSHDPGEIAAWAMRELRKIQIALEAARARKVDWLHVEPQKPFEGLIVGADGTDWNPGAGQGVYAYYNSSWNRLG